MKNIESTVMNVTPEMATEWLAKANVNNRNIRQTHVEYLTGIIDRGEWELTHQGIAFDVDDILLDGQHRLAAIVRAGKSVIVNVTKNLPKSARKGIDQGIIRTQADIAGINSRLAQEANLCAYIINPKKAKFSPREIGYYAKFLAESSEKVYHNCPTSKKIVNAAPFRMAAIFSIDNGFDEEYVLDMHHRLVYGKYQGGNNALFTAIKMVNGFMMRRVSSSERTHVVFKAIQIFNPANSDTIKAVKFSESGIARMRKDFKRLYDPVY